MSKEAVNIEVTAQNLQGPGLIACPNPQMKLWSNHPKVYLDVLTTGEAKCPYCGTVYRIRPGEKLHSH
ncbi:MAG: zinc-finger domain-containing protein [Burkholderiales bacterium]|jgi:uncharacterized Zn-finger protein